MTLRVVDQAEKHFLGLILSVGYDVRLFSNDVESGLTTAQKDALTEADFTEATFTGYASASTAAGGWTTGEGNPGTASYTARTFTSSADQTPEILYGYYVTRTSDDALQWYEYFSASATIQYSGQSIVVTPAITLADGSD